jgi:pimeloyl-ACP methyl ester carboxylesterase
MTTTLQTVTSADGTSIAFERVGDGPAVILVGGAFNDRSTVAALAATLAPDFTTIAYDRRGRGASGDRSTGSGVAGKADGTAAGTAAVEREVADIAALIAYAGGSASVFGHSSGAVLALEAAQRGLPITRLALYEPAYVVDGGRARPGVDLLDRLQALVDRDRRDEAATLFLTEAVSAPPEVVEGMRASQMWGWFTGLAHTLPYDVAVCGPGNDLPADRLATIAAPTLAIGGSLSPAWLRAAARAVADAVPGGRYVTLDGQDHGVLHQPDALRPLLVDFLG